MAHSHLRSQSHRDRTERLLISQTRGLSWTNRERSQSNRIIARTHTHTQRHDITGEGGEKEEEKEEEKVKEKVKEKDGQKGRERKE